MKKIVFAVISLVLLLAFLQSCKKNSVTIYNYTRYVATDKECRVTGAADTTQWANNFLNRAEDTAWLTYTAGIVISDSACATIVMSPPCPNPSNGFFVWDVNPSRQCKLKVVCISTAQNILYYNTYALNGGPITLGFDFRSLTAFRNDSSYRMYFGFYNSRDSLYYSGHGDIKIAR